MWAALGESAGFGAVTVIYGGCGRLIDRGSNVCYDIHIRKQVAMARRKESGEW